MQMTRPGFEGRRRETGRGYKLMKRTCIFIVALLLAAAPALSMAAQADNPFVSPRGSCNYISGTTVIVTIFVDDPYHQWKWFDRSEDATSYFRVHSRLETAANWLESQVARYGGRANIVWDWHDRPYLYNWYTSKNNMRSSQYTYSELRSYITENIPLDKIKEYYGADNVLFLALYNQDINEKSRGVSYPLDFWEYAGTNEAYEILWIMVEDSGLTVSAAGLAHEIMHCFGAVDLYEGSDFTTDAYLRHLRAINSNDIMYSIDYRDPDHIGESFSDLDAYYMGLRSYSADREQYNLRRSSFDR